MNKKFKYIYGPVYSWRFGISLGLDLLSQKEKICNFNCIYCQLGCTKKYSIKRKIYVPTEKLLNELKNLPQLKLDYITFSGKGEPTLALNLGEAIKAIRTIRKEPILVLTNSSLIDEAFDELLEADFVSFKIDAFSQKFFKEINSPISKIKFSRIVDGIKNFKKKYSKKIALQIMFIKENSKYAKEISQIAKDIEPYQVQLNTPLRAFKEKAISKEEMEKIKKYFEGLNIITVYTAKIKKVEPLDKIETAKRRPN
ncbi:MAG: radical SAM protein [Candidatus Aenigmatarchaeota archaeon]